MRAFQVSYPNEIAHRATDYRRFAEQCISIAETASPEVRKQLLRMAETWFGLVLSELITVQRTIPDQNAPSSNRMQ